MNLLFLLAGGLSAGPVNPPPALDPRPADNYLELGAGFLTTEDSDGPDEEVDFDEGYLLSLAFGHRFASATPLAFDLELEGYWSDQDADSGVEEVTGVGALVNGLLDYRLTERFSLYGGGGIGLSWLDVDTESDALNDFDEEDGPFLAWQAKAGVAFAVSEAVELRLGYRFLNVDDAEIDDDLGGADFDLETQHHVVEAGLRFGLSG